MTALYDRIGRGYDRTRRADPGVLRRLIELLAPEAGRSYVDAACGTGNYTLALAAAGVSITGFDASRDMIAAAEAKPRPRQLRQWLVADAAATPFEDGAFAGAVCTLAIHHFPDLPAALGELGRIVDAARGRLVIFTSLPEQMRHYWLGRYFPEMMRRSADQMLDAETIETGLAGAGFSRVDFEPYSVAPDLEDSFLYSGKHRPERYLDPEFRAGISSFANLCAADELANGLARLSDDIASGAIAEAEYAGGDYLFARARR